MQEITSIPCLDQQNGIEKIVEIMNKDIFFIPKTILLCDEVYEESKVLFSAIFTDCLYNLVESENYPLTISKAMKEKLYAMNDMDIQLGCFCPEAKVHIVKTEVLRLINHTNISSCIRDSRLEVI